MSESSSPTKYRHVFDELRKEILSGRYQPGHKLPSEAELVKLFGTSRITVGRAVRDLQDQGLVERRAGSGTYVRGTAGSGMTFGLLIPALGQTEIFEPICQGMADSVEGGEHALLWCNVNPVDESKTRQEYALQLCEQYIKRKISGVFFAPFESLGPDDSTNERIVEALDKARIPVVLLDRDFTPYPKRSTHDLVGIDNRRTGFLATEHLFQLGHRRVAFVSYPRTAATVHERIAGYREAHFVHKLPLDPALVQRLEAEDAESVRRFVEEQKPQGVVCANDRTAGQLMHSLIALGVNIPTDVSIVGIDDIHYASLLPVPLTTIRQPCREIGMAAMSAMLERVRRPSMPTRDILLECTLVERQSCAVREK